MYSELLSNIEIQEQEAAMNVVASTIDYTTKMLTIMEQKKCSVDDLDVYMEAAGEKKPGLFKRIWNGILTVLRAIGNFFKMIGRKIAGLFKKNKGKKSADQILVDLKVKPVTESALMMEGMMDMLSMSSAPERKRLRIVHFPSSKRSTAAPTDAKVMAKSALVMFDKNSRIRFYSGAIGNTLQDLRNGGISTNLPQHNIVRKHYWMQAVAMIDCCVSGVDLETQFDKLLKALFSTDPDSKHQCCAASMNLVHSVDVPDDVYEDDWFDLDVYMEAAAKLNKLCEKMNSIDINNLEGVDEDKLKALNAVLIQYHRVQYGMNTLGVVVDYAWDVDASFLETVDSEDTLGEFVHEQIVCGLPPKNVARNTYLVASKRLRGTSNVEKPIWGQTRVVLFPNDNDRALKIALSGAGTNANKFEVAITKVIKNNKRAQEILIPITHAYGGDAIVEQPRIDTSEDIDNDSLLMLRAELIEVEKDIGSKWHFGDIHSKNVCKYKNRWAAFDYGGIDFID